MNFIFSPVTPAGISIKAIINRKKGGRKYFWAFTESSWLNPYIKVAFDDFTRHGFTDSEISWYYQCKLKDLNSEELEKEKEYRKKKGLPEIE